MSETNILIGPKALTKAVEIVKQQDTVVHFHGMFIDKSTIDMVEFMGHYYLIVVNTDDFNKCSFEEASKDRFDCLLTALKGVAATSLQIGGF